MSKTRPMHEVLSDAIKSTYVESVDMYYEANDRPKVVVRFFADDNDCVEIAKFLKDFRHGIDIRDE